jgi:toluene monooxygenase system protein D
VGPVLQASELGRAVALAIVELNPGAQVLDRGGYYRVLVEEHCAVTRSAIERISGRPFILPGDLESVMPAFTGQLSLNAFVVSWTHETA